MSLHCYTPQTFGPFRIARWATWGYKHATTIYCEWTFDWSRKSRMKCNSYLVFIRADHGPLFRRHFNCEHRRTVRYTSGQTERKKEVMPSCGILMFAQSLRSLCIDRSHWAWALRATTGSSFNPARQYHARGLFAGNKRDADDLILIDANDKMHSLYFHCKSSCCAVCSRARWLIAWWMAFEGDGKSARSIAILMNIKGT